MLYYSKLETCIIIHTFLGAWKTAVCSKLFMFHTATEPSRQAVANSFPSLEVATPTTSWAWPHTSLTFVPSDQLMYQTHPLAQPATPYDIIIVRGIFGKQSEATYIVIWIAYQNRQCTCTKYRLIHSYSLPTNVVSDSFLLTSFMSWSNESENIPEPNCSWVSCDTDSAGETFF